MKPLKTRILNAVEQNIKVAIQPHKEMISSSLLKSGAERLVSKVGFEESVMFRIYRWDSIGKGRRPGDIIIKPVSVEAFGDFRIGWTNKKLNLAIQTFMLRGNVNSARNNRRFNSSPGKPTQRMKNAETGLTADSSNNFAELWVGAIVDAVSNDRTQNGHAYETVINDIDYEEHLEESSGNWLIGKIDADIFFMHPIDDPFYYGVQ